MEKIICLFVPTFPAMPRNGRDWTLILVDRNNQGLVLVVDLFYIKDGMPSSLPTLAMARVQVRIGGNGIIHRSEAGRLSLRLHLLCMRLFSPHQ
jgi:hypothetical protein